MVAKVETIKKKLRSGKRPVGWLQGLMARSAKALSIKVSNGLKKITEVIKEVD